MGKGRPEGVRSVGSTDVQEMGVEGLGEDWGRLPRALCCRSRNETG